MEKNDLTTRIGFLIAREFTHGLTTGEAAELRQWKLDNPEQAAKMTLLLKKDNLLSSLKELDEVEEKITRDFLAAGMPVQRQVKPSYALSPNKRWWAAAAILILAFSIGFYRSDLFTPVKQVAIQQQKEAASPIVPGKEGAILTLADGTTMMLDSMGNGNIATQGNTRITLDNGKLAYNVLNNSTGGISYNTMTTPKGRQFHLILPDGSHVWLNAASSLRYPTSFTGNERLVEVTGEAYFEVASNVKMPFKVSTLHKTAIEVLGTHFNVKAYSDEDHIYTTLLEGAVRVQAGNQKSLLAPGHQADIHLEQDQPKQMLINKHADVAKAMAWKNGLFDFQDVKLEELMRQISRWYDIEVVYENAVPNIEFWGKMGMDLPLTDVLTFLKKSDVHFRIEERKLIVAK